MAPINILFLEDDELTLGIFLRYVRQASRDSELDIAVREVYTESDFSECVEAGRFDDVDIFILDANVSWAESESRKQDPPPIGVDRSDSFSAGLRCAKLVLDRSALGECPVFLFTVTPRSRILQSKYSYLLEEPRFHLVGKSERFPAFAHQVVAEAVRIRKS